VARWSLLGLVGQGNQKMSERAFFLKHSALLVGALVVVGSDVGVPLNVHALA
jgi:hypothetical protein